MKKEPAWIRVIRPPIVAIVTVGSAIYSLLFAWWLDDRVARKLDARLAQRVRENLSFLFTEKNARVVPSDDYRVARAFDLSVVTVATNDLYIRVITVRGEFDVEVASPDLPHRWEELSSAIESAKLGEGAGLKQMIASRRVPAYSFYPDVERLLRSHWTLLTRYCGTSV